jgi:hypothetical protein
MKNNKGKAHMGAGVYIGALVVFGVFLLGGLWLGGVFDKTSATSPILSATGGAQIQTQTPTAADTGTGKVCVINGVVCNIVGGTTWTPGFKDQYAPGTSIGDDQYAYKLISFADGSVKESSGTAKGTDINANPCDKYELISSSNATANTSITYVPMKFTGTIPCIKNYPQDLLVPDASDPGFTIQVKNPNGVLNGDGSDTTTAGYDISANDQDKIFQIDITGTSEDQFGSTGVVIGCEQNVTALTKMELSGGSPAPSLPWLKVSSTDNTWVLKEYPAVISNGHLLTDLKISAHQTNWGEHNLSCIGIPNRANRNADTLAYEHTYTDQDSAQATGATVAFTIFMK